MRTANKAKRPISQKPQKRASTKAVVAAKEPRKVGRPSSFTNDIADKICRELALGRSLRSICTSSDMPDQTTVFRWLESNEEFREQYARAREIQADTHADQLVDIADNATDANLARLQIDARKWTAAKLRPKRYGDRVTNEHTGADGGPVETQGKVELSDESLERLKRLVE